MKISIITISYNSAATIEDTIQSVIAQDYADKEYVVVDGASKDGTQEIISRYASQIQTFVSEKDKGIYDAMNKGVGLAKGDVIGILNSDDFYADEKVLSEVAEIFRTTNCDGLYADLVYVNRNLSDKVIRTWAAGEYQHGKFLKGWMPPHPTFFVKREFYEKYGKYSLELKSASDYELMLRFIHKHQIKMAYLPRVIIKMRAGGQSNVTIMNRIKANMEDRMAWKMNGLHPSLFTLTRKPLSKVFQFLKA